MRVELDRLSAKPSNFANTYAVGELILDEERVEVVSPAIISGRIIRKERKVIVEGHLEASVRVECDRCLRTLSVPIDTNFTVELITPEAYQALDAAELEEADLALSVFETEFIDVDDITREQLLLAVPSHVICEEGCKGLCPACGADRNLTACQCQATQIDPRWEGLKELVNGK